MPLRTAPSFLRFPPYFIFSGQPGVRPFRTSPPCCFWRLPRLSRRAVPRLTQMRDQGAPISVQWHVHQGDGGGFRIGDIVVEGVSMAVTYRSDYAAAMQANGGRIDSLLSSMRTKIDQLKANN